MKNFWDLLFHLLGPQLKGNHVKISIIKTQMDQKIYSFHLFSLLLYFAYILKSFSCKCSKSKPSEEDVPYETKGFDYGKYALVSQNYSVFICFSMFSL